MGGESMNKKGLEFKLAFFAIIIVGVLVAAAGTWIGNWNTTYDSNLTYDLGEYNRLDDVSSTAQTQSGNISVSSSTSDTGFEGSTLRGAFGILSNIYKPFKIVFGDGGMLDAITERFGLPDYVRHALVTMIVIAITFALIMIFFGRTQAR